MLNADNPTATAAYHCRAELRDNGYEVAGGMLLSIDSQGSQVITVYSTDGNAYASATTDSPEEVEFYEV